jgi:hypothetical protein
MIRAILVSRAKRSSVQTKMAELRSDAPVKQPFDRKGYHSGYMWRWRARRIALLNGDHIG